MIFGKLYLRGLIKNLFNIAFHVLHDYENSKNLEVLLRHYKVYKVHGIVLFHCCELMHYFDLTDELNPDVLAVTKVVDVLDCD